MKKKLLTTAILLTGLLSASTYHYTFKISDTSLFNNSQQASSGPTMQDSTPQERTGVTSTGVILASDGGVDWYGEVSSANFISGVDLANMVGLTSGTSQYSDEGWLHVGLDGTELFIAKKPFRSGISFNQLENLNIVYGDEILTIENNNYKIRLMKCSIFEPSLNGGFDSVDTHNSEWNRVFYRMTQNNDFQESEMNFINLANYSNEELLLYTTSGFERLCQETTFNRGRVITRGNYTNINFVSAIGNRFLTYNSSSLGWMPILEKIN